MAIALLRRSCGVLGTVVLSVCSSASAQDGTALLHRMQQALGGADKIASVRDVDELVRAQTWHEDGSARGDVRKRTRWINPNCLRLDQVGSDNNTYVLYFDGSSGWEIVPDKSGVVELTDDERKFAQRYLQDLNFKFWLADRDPEYGITSPAPNVIRLQDKRDSQNVQDVTLDPSSGLPTKKTVGNKTTQFDEWGVAAGVRYPRVSVLFIDNQKRATITVDRIKLNGGLNKNEISARPRDLKPNLGVDAH
jgi:outer membrane lipoprotein-sorting protein